jgi:hypothetical protein
MGRTEVRTILAITMVAALAACSSSPGNLTPQADPQYTLQVERAGGGSGTVTSSPAGIDCGSQCTAQFQGGASVVLTATPSADSAFDGWSGGCTGAGTCQVTITDNTTVTVAFQVQQGDEPAPPSSPPAEDEPPPPPPPDDPPPPDEGDGPPPEDPEGDNSPDTGDPPQDEQLIAYGQLVSRQDSMRGGEFRNGFAGRVEISGTTAAVGSLGGQDASTGDGMYVFELAGQDWVETAHFNVGQEMGAYSTARGLTTSGDYAAVSYECVLGHCNDEPSGFVIYERQDGEWVEVAHFRGDEHDQWYGWGLAFSGDYLIASHLTPGGSSSVEVYQRRSGTWELTQVISTFGSLYGPQLDASSTHFAVLTQNSVHVYRLENGTWELQVMLYGATTETTRAVPGSDSIAISDNFLVTSKPGETSIIPIEDGNWRSEETLTASGPVALAEPYLLIGQARNDDQGEDAGAVLVYERVAEGEWELVNTLYAADPVAGEGFGVDVAATPEYAVVGADDGDREDRNPSAAYFFEHARD